MVSEEVTEVMEENLVDHSGNYKLSINIQYNYEFKIDNTKTFTYFIVLILRGNLQKLLTIEFQSGLAGSNSTRDRFYLGSIKKSNENLGSRTGQKCFFMILK